MLTTDYWVLALNSGHQTLDKRVDKRRLPNPRLPRHKDHLPLARFGFDKQIVQLCQFGFSSN